MLINHQSIQATRNDYRNKERKGNSQNNAGCSLSPLIFNVFIEAAIVKVLESVEGGIGFNGKRVVFVRFADDIAAFASTSLELEKILNTMDTIFREFGLKINNDKTKIMIISKHGKGEIKVDGRDVKQVQKNKYLGSIITEDSMCTPEIKARIGMAKQIFYKKTTLLKSKISIGIRKRFIKVHYLTRMRNMDNNTKR